MLNQIESLLVGLSASVKEVIAKIDFGQAGIVLVVDKERRLLGTITDGDVRRALLAGFDLGAPISSLLARKSGSLYAEPIFGKKGSDAGCYLELMQKHRVAHLPIVDDERKVAGLVTREEFLPNSLLPVQAVIMAGGEGNRLRPLTLDLPKPMLPIGDRPLMELIIERLQSCGIRRINITTHYKAEKIFEHFKDGDKFGVELSYLQENSPLGTGGALGLLQKPSETTLVINGDIFTQVDFRAMLAYHMEHDAALTVAVRYYDIQVPYGVIESQDSRVVRVAEKPLFGFFINAGIYLLEPQVYQYIAAGQPLQMTDLLSRLINDGRVVVSFPIREQWLDIGAHEDYKKAQEYASQAVSCQK